MRKEKLGVCGNSTIKFMFFSFCIARKYTNTYLFFMSRITPKNMMTKRRMPAMTPAIFTVWSVCFSGSTASGL